MANISCIGQVLGNPTKSCRPIDLKRIRRHLLTSRIKEDGSLNNIAASDAVLITNWQTLFAKYKFDTDAMTKVVPLVENHNFVQTNENPIVFSEDEYRRTIFDGDEDVTMEFFEVTPELIASLKTYEDVDLASYLSDINGSLIGWTPDGVNLYPFDLEGFNVQNFKFPGEDVSREPATYRFNDPTQLNKAAIVDVLDTDGNKVNMSQKLGDAIYHLLDCTNVVDTPAVTGCNFTAKTAELITSDAVSITGITYDEIALVNSSTGVVTSLAASGSLTYNSTTEKYTINEATLLTSGQTYYLRISHSKFDIAQASVIVP